MKKLAVIILNWNGLSLLEQFLPAASLHTRGEEVDLIVADNGSDDDSVAWIEANHPEVKIVRLDHNYGFAEGYNRAIEATHYPYTLLLNSDVEVTPGWWQPLLKFMEENPEAGACQPKILSYKDKSRFEYAGAAGGYLDALGYPYCRGRLFDSIEKDLGQYDGAPEEICWASGAAMMVDTRLYLSLGGLDQRFFAHMEEIDLCCRIHAGGRKVFAVPYSKVYHVGGASLDPGNPRKTYLNFRNNLLLLHKNLPRSKGKRILFVRRLADTCAYLMFLLKGEGKQASAVLKAHKDFRSMRRQYTTLPEFDYMSSLPGAKRKILLDYYIFRKKK